MQIRYYTELHTYLPKNYARHYYKEWELEVFAQNTNCNLEAKARKRLLRLSSICGLNPVSSEATESGTLFRSHRYLCKYGQGKKTLFPYTLLRLLLPSITTSVTLTSTEGVYTRMGQ